MRNASRICALATALFVIACSDTESDSNETKDGETGSAVLSLDTTTEECADPDTCVPIRVSERRELIMKGEFERAYDYLSPNYRATQNRKMYVDEMRNRPVTWVEAKYIDYKCDASDACNVNIEILARLNIPGSQVVETKSLLSERWIKAEEVWYFVPHKRR